MDLYAVHVKNLFRTNLLCHRPISPNSGRSGVSFGVFDGPIFEITVLKRKPCCKGNRPLVVSAAGKKNHDNSSSSVHCWKILLSRVKLAKDVGSRLLGLKSNNNEDGTARKVTGGDTLWGLLLENS